MKIKPYFIIGLTTLVVAVMHTAFGQVAEPTPAAKDKPIPTEVAPPPVFDYDAKGKRDPFVPNAEVFKPKIVECTVDCEQPAKNVRKPEPLELFNLESLKFVGILTFAGEIIAIIEDPSGHAYTIKTGNYMGSNEGKVMEIGSSHLTLLEKAPTPSDKNATRSVTLKLHKDEEEK
ncbi:MAG: pilus assembly protein PilP [Magnetococcales bacterium]|nr:pilus assembly protein PilP [Magnetococcales bacterium]NGZ25881.1 pilus assembly protein PilP [Magnetococcales bacterium]